MQPQYTLLDIRPDYRQFIITDLSMELVTLVMLAMLIVQYIRRKHHGFELTLFFQMCLVDLLMVVFSIPFDIAPLFLRFNEDNLFTVLYLFFSVSYMLDQILSITLITVWLIYMEFTLHQSQDLIKRRYRIFMVPYVIAVVVMLISIPGTYLLALRFGFGMILEYDIFITFAVISYAIFLFYTITAYIILYREKKRNRIPAYIRLTPTTLCMVAGFTLNLLKPDYPFLSLFFALGLMFADFYMYRRLRNVDPKTGFYNRRYLSVLIRLAKKYTLKGATIIRFRTQRGGDVLAAILKTWEPDLSKTIILEEGQFLLMSEPVKDPIAERFITLFTDAAKKEGILVEADYETDRESPIDLLLQKYG
ncbi:MAG: hypothetical protein K6F35_10865 [Lachnospiraceae bacterium]|nr:hypothetical protein [Lachnospiraceae bacterium]